MSKFITALTFVTLITAAVSAASKNVTFDSSSSGFSSPAAEVSWETGANMSGHKANEIASVSARYILESQAGYSSPSNYGYNPYNPYYNPYSPSSPGTYSCSNDCSRTCSYTCSSNYRCR